CLLSREAGERLGQHQLADAHVLDRAVMPYPSYGLTLFDLTVVHAKQCDSAEERRGVKVGDVCLQWALVIVARCGHTVEDGLKQGLKIEVIGQRPVCGSV